MYSSMNQKLAITNAISSVMVMGVLPGFNLELDMNIIRRFMYLVRDEADESPFTLNPLGTSMLTIYQ